MISYSSTEVLIQKPNGLSLFLMVSRDQWRGDMSDALTTVFQMKIDGVWGFEEREILSTYTVAYYSFLCLYLNIKGAVASHIRVSITRVFRGVIGKPLKTELHLLYHNTLLRVTKQFKS